MQDGRVRLFVARRRIVRPLRPRLPHRVERLRQRLNNLCDAFHFWSLHSGGANFLFADGSVRFMPDAANEITPALATRAGGEAVSWE